MSPRGAPRARKRFGQHFLSDEFVLGQIGAAVAPTTRDALFEIGPGQGALTAALYGQPARYRAVEIDRDLVPALRARFPELDLIEADVLAVPMRTLLADGPWRVVGNLPYNITSPLLGALFDALDCIVDVHAMVQKEVAARIAASPGSKNYGRLTVATQVRVQTELLFTVLPESFTPPPAVDSAVIRLTPLAPSERLCEPVLTALDRVLRLAFAQRRKRLANALKTLALPWAKLAVDPELRADQVSVAEYVLLARWVAGASAPSGPATPPDRPPD
ncbi:MAG: 16S rRNA (adenine(1518)-N(6)/adenine(1519)-N(6))-dimethyltransferase RsmA [Pseudomonadota bacterium]